MKLINIESSATVTASSLLALCDTDFTVLDLYTGKYWNYDSTELEWYEDIGGASKLGIPESDDYVLAKPTGIFKWIPNGGLTGVVESPLPELIKDGGAGTVTVPSMKIQAYPGSEFFGNPIRYQTVETTLSIPDGGGEYYIAFKDDMGPTVYTTTDLDTLNMSDRIPLYVASRIGTTIHSVGFDTQGVGLPQKLEKSILRTKPYSRTTEGGLSISEDGSRHILLTASTVFRGSTPIDVLAYDSNSANNLLTHCYHVGGVWTYSTVSAGNGQYNNTQYDNGTDLVSLGANKYKVVWVFRSVGDDKEVFYVNSTVEYNNSDAAQIAQVPSIPPVVSWHCILVGRIIVQNGASSGIVQSAFDKVFVASSASNHNNLSGLQGGTIDEYYHMTAAEATKLSQLQVIYDAVVSTSAELQSALESTTVQSIYVRLTSSNVNIVLGSGSADQTITLGTSKNLFGQPFTVGSSTSYITTIALGSNNLRCRNDRVDVSGKLTFTGTGTAYIKKISPAGTSNLVVGVSGKLLVENLRYPTAFTNVTVTMWDIPLRMASTSSMGDQQVLRYNATTGEWAPITLTGPSNYPLIKGVDSMLFASAASSVALNRNAGQYVVHLTKITPNGDLNLDVNSKVQYYVTQAASSPTISWCIALYEDVTDYSAGTVVPTLALIAYSNMSTSTISASIDYVENTLSNLAAGVTGLSASKPYYIGLFWKCSGDFYLLGISGSNLNPTYKTRGPALWVDNLGSSLSAPPDTIVNTSTPINEATGRHFFRIYNP